MNLDGELNAPLVDLFAPHKISRWSKTQKKAFFGRKKLPGRFLFHFTVTGISKISSFTSGEEDSLVDIVDELLHFHDTQIINVQAIYRWPDEVWGLIANNVAGGMRTGEQCKGFVLSKLQETSGKAAKLDIYKLSRFKKWLKQEKYYAACALNTRSVRYKLRIVDATRSNETFVADEEQFEAFNGQVFPKRFDYSKTKRRLAEAFEHQANNLATTDNDEPEVQGKDGIDHYSDNALSDSSFESTSHHLSIPRARAKVGSGRVVDDDDDDSILTAENASKDDNWSKETFGYVSAKAKPVNLEQFTQNVVDDASVVPSAASEPSFEMNNIEDYQNLSEVDMDSIQNLENLEKVEEPELSEFFNTWADDSRADLAVSMTQKEFNMLMKLSDDGAFNKLNVLLAKAETLIFSLTSQLKGQFNRSKVNSIITGAKLKVQRNCLEVCRILLGKLEKSGNPNFPEGKMLVLDAKYRDLDKEITNLIKDGVERLQSMETMELETASVISITSSRASKAKCSRKRRRRYSAGSIYTMSSVDDIEDASKSLFSLNAFSEANSRLTIDDESDNEFEELQERLFQVFNQALSEDELMENTFKQFSSRNSQTRNKATLEKTLRKLVKSLQDLLEENQPEDQEKEINYQASKRRKYLSLIMPLKQKIKLSPDNEQCQVQKLFRKVMKLAHKLKKAKSRMVHRTTFFDKTRNSIVDFGKGSKHSTAKEYVSDVESLYSREESAELELNEEVTRNASCFKIFSTRWFQVRLEKTQNNDMMQSLQVEIDKRSAEIAILTPSNEGNSCLRMLKSKLRASLHHLKQAIYNNHVQNLNQGYTDVCKAVCELFSSAPSSEDLFFFLLNQFDTLLLPSDHCSEFAWEAFFIVLRKVINQFELSSLLDTQQWKIRWEHYFSLFCLDCICWSANKLSEKSICRAILACGKMNIESSRVSRFLKTLLERCQGKIHFDNVVHNVSTRWMVVRLGLKDTFSSKLYVKNDGADNKLQLSEILWSTIPFFLSLNDDCVASQSEQLLLYYFQIKETIQFSEVEYLELCSRQCNENSTERNKYELFSRTLERCICLLDVSAQSFSNRILGTLLQVGLAFASNLNHEKVSRHDLPNLLLKPQSHDSNSLFQTAPLENLIIRIFERSFSGITTTTETNRLILLILNKLPKQGLIINFEASQSDSNDEETDIFLFRMIHGILHLSLKNAGPGMTKKVVAVFLKTFKQILHFPEFCCILSTFISSAAISLASEGHNLLPENKQSVFLNATIMTDPNILLRSFSTFSPGEFWIFTTLSIRNALGTSLNKNMISLCNHAVEASLQCCKDIIKHSFGTNVPTDTMLSSSILVCKILTIFLDGMEGNKVLSYSLLLRCAETFSDIIDSVLPVQGQINLLDFEAGSDYTNKLLNISQSASTIEASFSKWIEFEVCANQSEEDDPFAGLDLDRISKHRNGIKAHQKITRQKQDFKLTLLKSFRDRANSHQKLKLRSGSFSSIANSYLAVHKCLVSILQKLLLKPRNVAFQEKHYIKLQELVCRICTGECLLKMLMRKLNKDFRKQLRYDSLTWNARRTGPPLIQEFLKQNVSLLSQQKEMIIVSQNYLHPFTMESHDISISLKIMMITLLLNFGSDKGISVTVFREYVRSCFIFDVLNQDVSNSFETSLKSAFVASVFSKVEGFLNLDENISVDRLFFMLVSHVISWFQSARTFATDNLTENKVALVSSAHETFLENLAIFLHSSWQLLSTKRQLYLGRDFTKVGAVLQDFNRTMSNISAYFQSSTEDYCFLVWNQRIWSYFLETYKLTMGFALVQTIFLQPLKRTVLLSEHMDESFRKKVSNYFIKVITNFSHFDWNTFLKENKAISKFLKEQCTQMISASKENILLWDNSGGPNSTLSQLYSYLCSDNSLEI